MAVRGVNPIGAVPQNKRVSEESLAADQGDRWTASGGVPTPQEEAPAVERAAQQRLTDVRRERGEAMVKMLRR